ncbi:type II toxin-antitoxin system PemK/MazF family toxin [Microbacterium sp.]|uniref:type II toxin-antitoxin system PemK/MazF family toxin n=1 Tax=Microbacterium sp. TaxID=51671 RepID=UPI0037365C4A
MGFFSRVMHLLAPQRPDAGASQIPHIVAPGGGASANAASIVEIAPPGPGALELVYAAQPDGRPDAGEVVWGWVPFQEDPTQGKDRPLLLIAEADGGRVFAMKLTSREPDRPDGSIFLGTGPWDRAGRPSWLDTDQVYLVPRDGVRREGAAVSPEVFADVATELATRFGWRVRG